MFGPERMVRPWSEVEVAGRAFDSCVALRYWVDKVVSKMQR